MSFIPDLGQVQKNKTILQELEEKKRRMRSGNYKFVNLLCV